MNIREGSWDHADCFRGRDRNVVNWFFCRPNILNFSSWWWTEEIRISRGVITRKYSETLRPSAAWIPDYWAQLCCQCPCEIFQIQYCLQNFLRLRRSTRCFACFPSPSPMFLLCPAHFLLVNTINKNQITILIWCGCWWLVAGAGWAVMVWKFLNSLFSRFSCWAMINSSGSRPGHYSAVRGHLTNTSIQQMKTSKCWCFNAFFVAFKPEAWRDAVLPTNWLKVGLYFEGFPEM